MKKNKTIRNNDFKADMQTIKQRDTENLQKTFRKFFGPKPDEMKVNSSKLKKQVYFFGFVVSVIMLGILVLTQKIKFVGF